MSAIDNRAGKSRLIDADGKQRDAFGEARSEAVGRVYRRYYLE